MITDIVHAVQPALTFAVFSSYVSLAALVVAWVKA